MSLLAELLALDGEILVEGDAATVRLDKALAEAKSLPPEVRAQVQATIAQLRAAIVLQIGGCHVAEAALLERAADWEVNSKQLPYEDPLAEQARDRAEQARLDAAGVTEELAEHEATVRRLDEISRLLDHAARE